MAATLPVNYAAQGRTYSLCALSFAFLADDVAPAIKSAARGAVSGIVGSGQELLSYGESGLYETKKVILLKIPEIAQELSIIPRTLLLPIVEEIGDSFKTALQELCKYTLTAWSWTKEACVLLWQGLIYPLLAEIGSTLFSGAMQALSCIVFCYDVLKETAQLAYHIIAPFVEELLSSLYSGASEALKGVIFGLGAAGQALSIPAPIAYSFAQEVVSTLPPAGYELAKAVRLITASSKEALLTTYHVTGSLLKELRSDTITGIQELAKGALHLGSIFQEMAQLAGNSPLRALLLEIASDCRSGAGEILKVAALSLPAFLEVTLYLKELLVSIGDELLSTLKSGFSEAKKALVFAALAVLEAAIVVKNLAQDLGQEVASSVTSGLEETVKALIFAYTALDEATLYPRSFVSALAQELFSSIPSGASETAKAFTTILATINEGTLIPRTILYALLTELTQDILSGAHELLKSAIQVSTLAAETLRIPAFVALASGQELLSYSVSGFYETGKGLQVALNALKESATLIVSGASPLLSEVASDLKSAQGELRNAGDFVAHNVGAALYDITLAPIGNKFSGLIEEGRRIRALRAAARA